MTTIIIADVEKIAQQAAKYHHPLYQGVTKNEYNRIRFTFKPFTGAEDQPSQPRGVWEDESLSHGARELLHDEYQEAHTLWRDAKYVRGLKAAAEGAPTLWGTYNQARKEMGAAFAALDTAPDTHWRASVSKLVAAQDKTLAAATKWDDKAEEIATVHEKFLYSDLSHDEAYRQAGVDAAGWVVGLADDYGRSYYGTQSPLVRQVTEAIEAQREHLRKIAALTGDGQG